MTTVRRLQRELKDIRMNQPDFCKAWPVDENNLFDWKAEIYGPKDTPYEGGTFKLTIKFCQDYPFKAPHV